MDNSLNFLGKRQGFNVALRHFKGVTSMIKEFESGSNLSDILNRRLEAKTIDSFQISPIINALLVDKYKYYIKSINLDRTYSGQLSNITKIVKDWSAFDINIIYYHPQLGVILINPKNEESWSNIDSMRENELAVIYVGNFNKQTDYKLAEKCTNELIKLLNSEITDTNMVFRGESSEVPAAKTPASPAPKPEAKPAVQKAPPAEVKPSSSGKKKMSPHYGITVTNELFHNGNVEAWKRIIRSYENKYNDMKVFIFYEGEQIHDINTLFKWGKVKHGTNIYISLLGTEFKDISKLRRYLAQGASSRFEDFLKGDPTKDMVLF